MALGGFLAGLAQSSKQWPGAMQNRMLSQQQEEARRAEAERRTQEGVRQQREAIYERLRYLAEKGQTSAVEQGVAALPENFMPGLGQAFVGIAEDAALKQNQESDKRKIENSRSQAALNKAKNPDWQTVPGSQYMYRTDPETGKLEQTVGPSRDRKPPKVLTLVASEGAILNEDGSVTLIADKRVRDAIIASAKTDNPVEKIENGLVWYANGQSREWSNAEKQVYFDFEQEKANQSFANFVEREDYKNKLALSRFTAQATIQLSNAEKKEEWERLQQQSESIVEIFNINLEGLQKGFENPERAIESSRIMLENAQVPPQRIADLLQEWEPVYNAYTFEFDLTSAQSNLIMENRGIQVSADKIHELLKDKDVKRHVGVMKGRLEDWRREFKGGKDTPQSVIDFRFELNNMVDAVRRARTGAAISETETRFYDDLLGTTRLDPDYLRGLMGSLVSSINAQSEDLYKGLWQDKYGYPPGAEEIGQINAKLLYQTNIGGASKETRLPIVTVGDAKNEQKQGNGD